MGRRTNTDEIIDDSNSAADEGPSKSARKRSATAAQKLGERLIALREADLQRLGLPEPLADAIRAARTMRSHGGLARQKQYIGKLMRAVDLAAIEGQLIHSSRSQALDAERFKRVEAWRDRLLAEGSVALAELGAWRTLSAEQRAQLSGLIQRAQQTSGSEAQRSGAARELFRRLRELFAAANEPRG